MAMRCRAIAVATGDVSIVTQRRPHRSALYAVVAPAACGIEDEVPGVGGHEQAALDHAVGGLHDVALV